MPRQGDNAFFPAIICFRLKAWNCMEKHKKACLCSQAKMRAWRCITVPGGRRVQFAPSGFVTGLSEGEWNRVKFEKEPQCFFIVHFFLAWYFNFLSIAELCKSSAKIFLTSLFTAGQITQEVHPSVFPVVPLPCPPCHLYYILNMEGNTFHEYI